MAEGEVRIVTGPVRRRRLILRQVDGEMLVYDLASDRMHRLNKVAALVFSLADGEHSVARIADEVAKRLGSGSVEHVVGHALDLLDAERLVEAHGRDDRRRRLSRRELLALLGASSALLPVVATLVAPTALEAASYLTPAQCAARNKNACSVQPRKCAGTPYTSCQRVGGACQCL